MTIEGDLEKYFDRLFPICRSITGDGFRKSLEIVREIIPLEVIDFPTGTTCFDWTVPDEWNIRDAYIVTPTGEKIARFSVNNLHVVGYSTPVDKEITLEELRRHLFTIKELPHAIPYITSYYKRNWGFCLSYNDFNKLEEGKYRVFIDSDLKPGHLRIGVCTIPGTSDKEILISTYLCHPSMAINELSGPLVAAFLYQKLLRESQLTHTVRFVFCPENIGAIAFLSRYGDHLREKLVAGYVINCVGHGDHYTYKRSRLGNSLADRAALNVLQNQEKIVEVIDFFAGGSDERQYCSPGFNLPIGLIMGTMYGKYKEYHTSADNKKLISFKALSEVIDIYRDVIKTIDENATYKSRVQFGTPQFSKNSLPLYPTVMSSNTYNPHNEYTEILLELINLCDGQSDLLNISEKKGYKMIDILEIKEKLVQANYLHQVNLAD